MKILIYGAGIVGCTYGWQLSKAGYDVSVLVRKEKKQLIEENGINIHCSDFRGGKKQIIKTVFRPKVIDVLSADNDYEYIIIATGNLHLQEILPILKESVGKAHLLFFQNIWVDDLDEIGKHLSPNQYFFGFPFMAGGGRDNSEINCAISGLKYSHTPLGEINGEITPRVQKMAEALEKANLKPIVYKQIKVWLITHYAVAVGLLAGITKAGGGKAFVSNSTILKETIKSIREGLSICSRIGINPQSEKANKLYYLPLFIGVPIAKKIYSHEALQLMFDGHTQHSPNEMKKMFEDITGYGQKQGVEMTFLKSLQQNITQIPEY